MNNLLVIKYAIFLCLFFLFQIQQQLFAQYAGWENIGCTNSINCVVRQNNDIWIGTPAGLIRMDAVSGECTLFNRANSVVPYNYISKIVIDKNDNIWIACETLNFPGNSGLVKISNGQWIAYDYTNSPLNSSSIGDIEIDSNNYLWIGIEQNEEGKVLYKFDGTDSWQAIDIATGASVPNPLINSITVDNNDVKWFGTEDLGLIRYDESKSQWQVFNTENSGIPHNIIYKVEADQDNVLWLSINQSSLMPDEKRGLVSYDGNDWVIYDDVAPENAISSTRITSICVDNQNNKWIGCKKDNMISSSATALNRYNNKDWSVYSSTNSGLINCPVLSVFQEDDSIFWFGQEAVNSYTYDSGLVKWEMSGNTWKSYNTNISGLPHNWIQTIIYNENDGFNWVGTHYGLYKFNDDSHFSFPLDIFPGESHSANAISVDNDSIWIGSGDIFSPGGLTLIFQGKYTFFTTQNSKLPSYIVTCILQVNKDLWVGTPNGLVKIDNANEWTVYNENNTPMPQADITCLYFKNNTLWIGTNRGVTRYMYTTNKWEYVSRIGGCEVSSLLCDENENLWIGTGFYGLGYYNGNSLQVYNTENSELVDPFVSDLTYDNDSNLWISTFGGVSVFNKALDNWNNYTIMNSGISSNSANCIAYNPSGKKIIIGSYSNMGLSVYNFMTAGIAYKPKTYNLFSFDLYPNPGKNNINLKMSMPVNEYYSWHIYNIYGKEIKRGKSSNTQTNIDISAIPDGLYIISVTHKNSTQTRKWLKQANTF